MFYIMNGNIRVQDTESFIKKGRIVHGDKYDYSKVNYTYSNDKVVIVCNIHEHGEFEQRPSSHLDSAGCPKCGILKNSNSIRSTTEEFVKKAKDKHGDKYDYSKVKYVNNTTTVVIICSIPNHGEFRQTPNYHLGRSTGCGKCAKIRNINSLRITFDDFVSRSIKIHDNYYSYDDAIYVDTATKIKIKCPAHGLFEQIPHSHLQGSGCSKCGRVKIGHALRNSTEDVLERIKEVHGDKYDYSYFNYIDFHTKVTLKCTLHNQLFEITPANLLHGKCEGCVKCSSIHNSECRRYSKETFILMANKVHKNYDYSESNYVDMNTKIDVKCNQCKSVFQVRPSKHIHRNSGCPKCTVWGHSYKAIRWLEYIAKKKNITIQHAQNGKEHRIGVYRIDGYCHATKTCYEFYGSFWHGDLEKYDSMDVNAVNKKTFGELYVNTLKKEIDLMIQGYRVVSMWEREWDVLEKTLNAGRKRGRVAQKKVC